MPAPEPVEACGSALNGGYAVQPPIKGPVLRKRLKNMTTPARAKNQ